ncbi:hypothetical protein APUTEX25_001628 [Auxenochlorella protothecoides]|uniref:Uncharacterized protein n=1 Tax=Auxenochlorella protothecoides TaxID=3075 RepID=A0A3M7KNV9_AUXPR|nr:hypothetical protein APUTEX25_001628 [Auxenochlorella protothecoides]|eukprot:RMZ52238.1 hypothetical protein APUTEX25_001628 [Auxenochlorella protothecoides]
MSVTAVAAAGTAVALWLYKRRQTELEWEEREYATHTGAHQAPQTFMEDLYYFAEGLRYTYSETLGRWGTADLLIGLTYLCRKNPPEHVTTDIARAGQPYGRSADTAATAASLRELREIRRVFQYCVGMRERRPGPQREYFATALGIGPEAILAQETRAGVLKPSFILARDDHLRAIVLIIRGTHSFKDMFTSLTGAAKPHHLVDGNGVVLGYSHFGMLAAARWDLPPKTGATATNPALRAVQPREPMMLLEAVPQTMYGRIRLCRDVLSDHIIPNYLASLDSALERLPPAFHPECVARAVHAPAWDPPVEEGEGCGLPETVGVLEPLMA